ncbi:unnamed protein product, partial [Aduncisulcus paluster]
SKDITELGEIIPSVNHDDCYLKAIVAIIRVFEDLFSGLRETPASVEPFRVELSDAKKTISIPFRNIRRDWKTEIYQQLMDLKDRKIIKKSSTSYHCATVIVPKKNNKLRLCVDYRPLNEITVGMGQVLPRIGDLFGAMGGMKFFAVLDLTAGYHQIPVEKSSQKYTSFVTEFGKFEYTRMPFGMKNAPPFFQETMNRVLTGLVNIICCVYLDDIVVFAMDMPSLIVRLIAVFMRLNSHNMKVNLEKTVIGAQEVEFLGFMISGFGIRRSPKKLKALKRMSVLKNKKDVRSFLGMASYLR